MSKVISLQEERLYLRDSQAQCGVDVSRKVTISKLIELLRDCPFADLRAQLADELQAVLSR